MKSLHDSIWERESTWGWVWALWPLASCLAPGWWCWSALDSGFPAPSFPRDSALLQREREKEGERQRLSKLRCAQLCWVPLTPFVVPTNEQISSGRSFIMRVSAWSACQDRLHHKSEETWSRHSFCLGITKVFWPWCWGIVLDVLADRPFISDIDLAGQHWGLLLANL